MTAKNDITGDTIKSKTSNENFEKGFEGIDWSVKLEPEKEPADPKKSSDNQSTGTT